MKRGAEIFAIILPVCLGLGLIYLCTTGRMEPAAALSVILGIALVVPLAASVARKARDEALYRAYEAPPELARR